MDHPKEDFHFRIYAFFLELGLDAYLTSTHSRHLEKFLQSDGKYVLALKNYYVQNNMWPHAVC